MTHETLKLHRTTEINQSERRRWRRWSLPLAAMAGLFVVGPAYAQNRVVVEEVPVERSPVNIEADLPLTIQDTVPQLPGHFELQLIGRWERPDEGDSDDRWLIEPRIEFGVVPNVQITASGPYLFGDAVENDGFAPPVLEVMWTVMEATTQRPGVALIGGAQFTKAAEAGGGDGIDPFIGVLMDFVLSEVQRIHVNGTWMHNAEDLAIERNGRYEAAVGYSHQINPRLMLLIDAVREQDMVDNVEFNFAEVGMRWGLTDQSVLGVGVGFGIGDESPDYRVTVGFQHRF